MLKKLFLPIFLLILIGYASLETLKISRFVKNEVTRQIVDNSKERENVIKELENDGKEIVYISEFQVDHFLGNAIELINNENVKICVMSATAYSVLTDEQKNIIEKYDVIVPVDVHTIERYGGGSARCMIAELFI